MGNLKIQENTKIVFLTRVQAKPKNLELNNFKLSQIWESGFFLGFLWEILKFKKIPKLCFLTKCFVTMCKAPRNSDHFTFQKRLGTSDSMTDGSSKQYSP